jgi:Na+/melibiose symporter-like transporter
MLALLLILVGAPLIVAALNGDPTVIETQDARLHGLYVGVVLVIVGFVIGKFWSLKWEMKRSAPAAGTTAQRQEPVEEQIDLFEPRNKA